MSEGLAEFNQLPVNRAEALLLDCCGAPRWARQMAAARPFTDVTALLRQAEQIWWSLTEQDWHAAFAAHPAIGARQAAPTQQLQSANWSHAEQSGTHNADDAARAALAEANRLYRDKFGYIFIVCATGKSAEEMLGLCRQRLHNEAAAELRQAAEEQRKITEIRLRKLLSAITQKSNTL